MQDPDDDLHSSKLLPQESTFPPAEYRPQVSSIPPPLPAHHSLPPIYTTPPPLPHRSYNVEQAYAVYLADDQLLGVYSLWTDAERESHVHSGYVEAVHVLITENQKTFLLAHPTPICMEEYLSDEELRESALSKLTLAERRALGL